MCSAESMATYDLKIYRHGKIDSRGVNIHRNTQILTVTYFEKIF